MEQYFIVNDMTTNNMKQMILLSTCGPTMYSLICSLVALSKVTDTQYTAVVDKINNHFNPCPSIIMKRYKFHSKMQQPGVSITMFVAEL